MSYKKELAHRDFFPHDLKKIMRKKGRTLTAALIARESGVTPPIVRNFLRGATEYRETTQKKLFNWFLRNNSR